MKLTFTLLFTFALAQASYAQNLGAQAGSQSGAAAQAGAQNSVTFNSKVPDSTTARIEAAPSLGGLALGSGHPCAYSPSSAQFSIIGGGAGYGAMKVDSACMLLLQSVAAGDKRAYQAAMYMIAARDKEACRAMAAAGMIQCGEKGAVTSQAAPSKVSSKSRPQARPDMFTSCKMDGGQVKIKYTKFGRSNKAAANQACLTSLGY